MDIQAGFYYFEHKNLTWDINYFIWKTLLINSKI